MIHDGQVLHTAAPILIFLFLSYLVLRRGSPAFARIALALCGTVAGGVLLPALFMLLIVLFRDGWNLFGLFVWGTLIFAAAGAIGGLIAALWCSEENSARRRVLGMLLLSVVGLAPVFLFALPIAVRSALPQDPPDGLHARGLANRDFAASVQSAVFQVPMKDGARALVVVDRGTRRAKLIAEDGYDLHGQSLSQDGERLLMVRSARTGKSHELISCLVTAWQCRVVLQTEGDVISPVEIERDKIIYASSPPVTMQDRVRYTKHDLYSVTVGAVPVKLSEAGLSVIHSINVTGRKVVFGAVDPRLGEPSYSIAGNRLPHSEIYEAGYDRDVGRVELPTPPLKPLVFTGGYSIDPALSGDGKAVAFRNAEYRTGGYQFDIVIVDIAGGLRRRIVLNGREFSRPVFAGHQVVFAEVFDNRYRVRAWSDSRDTFEDVFETSFSNLNKLSRAKLPIAVP